MDYYFLGAAAGGVLTDYYFWAAGRTRAPAPEGTANQPCGIPCAKSRFPLRITLRESWNSGVPLKFTLRESAPKAPVLAEFQVSFRIPLGESWNSGERTRLALAFPGIR